MVAECYHREWIMMAKLGNALQTLAQLQPAPPVRRIMLMYGYLHYGVCAKLRSLGVSCRVVYGARTAGLPMRKKISQQLDRPTFSAGDILGYARFVKKMYR